MYKFLNKDDSENGIETLNVKSLDPESGDIPTGDIELQTSQCSHGDQEEPVNKADEQSKVKPKRPNIIKVLKGTQWDKSFQEGQPISLAREISKYYSCYFYLCSQIDSPLQFVKYYMP